MELDLSEIEHEEVLAGTFAKFSYDDAWKLGTMAREAAIEHFKGSSIVIDISLISGQVLFHTVIGTGATTDNDEWVNRKKRTVFRFGKSSWYMGQKLKQKGKTLEEANFISEKDYACHGGSVPIRIDSFDGVVGALTISGLAQHEDHALAIDMLASYQRLQRE